MPVAYTCWVKLGICSASIVSACGLQVVLVEWLVRRLGVLYLFGFFPELFFVSKGIKAIFLVQIGGIKSPGLWIRSVYSSARCLVGSAGKGSLRHSQKHCSHEEGCWYKLGAFHIACCWVCQILKVVPAEQRRYRSCRHGIDCSKFMMGQELTEQRILWVNLTERNRDFEKEN